MAAPRQNTPHGPELDATEARQARPAQGSFSMLVISTVVGLVVVAIIWAVFAGPLHHAPLKPQVRSPEQASTYDQVLPQAKMKPNPSNTGSPNGGAINQQ
ncbi:MAG: hypothetical protein JO111_12065 [Caulobacteraceae bacterium]|nr:hypothetical protein [Caulobacteraceae bacterium]